MAKAHSTGSTGKTAKVTPKARSIGTRKANTLAARAEAIRRIRVSHMYRSKIYRGAKEDIVAAGLASPEQCPAGQGDASEIEYKLDGKMVRCSHQNCGKGPEFWVCVDDPQPRTCRTILKAHGDPCVLDELLSQRTCLFLALDDYIVHFEEHPTTNTTKTDILQLFAGEISAGLDRAKRLYSSNPTYQDQVSKAIDVIGKLSVAAESLSLDDREDDADIGTLLDLYVVRLGAHVANASEHVGIDEGGNWRRREKRIATLLGTNFASAEGASAESAEVSHG